MLQRLEIGGVKIFRSGAAFEYDGRTYGAGTFVIPLAQPCRPYIKDLLEPQMYPELKQYPGGPPLPPYDATGWTLPVQMGVRVVAARTPIDGPLSPCTSYAFGQCGVAGSPAKYYLVERRYNHAFTLLNDLLKKDVEVYWSDESFTAGDRTYPAGTLVIPGGEGIESLLQSLSGALEIPVSGANQPLAVKGSKPGLPRLGLYRPWTASMDEGWTRLVLDMYRFSYKNLNNEAVKEGKLEEAFDAIILPDLSTTGIVDGKRRREYEPLIGSAEMPEAYRGGIGKEGVLALLRFIEAGGTLITFSEACDFAIEKLRLPAVNALKDYERDELYVPGSLLRIKLDTRHPLAYGMPDHAAVRFTQCPAFRLLPYIRESRAVGYYEDGNPLLSGWLIGPEKLAGKTALAEIPVKKGRVILFGFRVQSRAQTFGTFKLLFNAICSSGVLEIESLEPITR
jgi:hypothetical protein